MEYILLKLSKFYRFLLLFATLLASGVFAQNNTFRFDKITSENIKIEKGLSVNSVNCILQDTKGFIWFGTWDGLNKFDGYKFTVYKANEFEKNNELCNQTVRALFEDKDSNLWIGTEGGLNKFQRKSQIFTQYKHHITDKTSLSNDTILSILEDSHGNFWIGTQNGLNLFNKQSGKVIRILNNPADKYSISNDVVYDIIEDKQGFIWFATKNGLNRYNCLNKKFTHYFYDNKNENSICSNKIFSIIQDKTGDIWIATDNGICRLEVETEKIIRYYHDTKNQNSISSNEIKKVFEDSKGLLWIGTSDHGLITYDKKNNIFNKYQYTPDADNSLSSNSISSIYEDKAGIIWVATSKGVNKIDRNSYKFMHYQHEENDNNSLSNNLIWTFCNDKANGTVLIGTSDGLDIFDKKTASFIAYKINTIEKNNLSENLIKAIIKDKEGNFWVGTEGAGVFEINISESGKFKKINILKKINTNQNLSDNYVWCLQEDNKGYIWIGTNNGLNRYDIKKNEIKIFKHNSYNPYSISNNIINVMYQDKDSILWIGTYNGLDRYESKTGKFYTYLHNYKDAKSLSNNRVFGILEDENGIMWIATLGGGLNKLNKRTGIFKYYTEKDGLANNVVYCILEDNKENLWLTTNSGISKFNILSETFVNYDIKDGVQSSEFNQNAAMKTNDGQIYLGGMNGFNAFYPNEIILNKFIPPIVVTSFKIFNQAQDNEIKDGETITLPYKDNFFSFEFSALDYSNPAKNKYKYKLEKFDKEWIYCDAGRRFAEYTKVSPGTYIFKVKGSNCDGVWNEKGISITIIITPPWWATWTFRISFISFLIFIGWFTITRRIKQIHKKHQIEKKVLEIEKQVFDLEQKALRLQMNPHFIFNSLNSIQSFIINNDSDKATLYLAKFAQLMRLILSNSSESFVPVKDEMKALAYYMDIENLRFDNKFDYKIIVDPEIDDDFIGIPPMIIQPYVENAILHGIIHKPERGNISIKLTLQSNTILCIIEDNGVGREKAMEFKNHSGLVHKSRGMIITKDRLEILNKQQKGHISVNVIDMNDENGNSLGTKVEIIIPFKDI